MTFTIKGSHILAILITVAIGIWMYGGELKIGGQSDSGQTATIAEEDSTPKEVEAAPFKVSYLEIFPIKREQTVNMRGRTKAEAVIAVRAETGGVLEKRLVNRGDQVNTGDLVCVLDQGSRQAALASAQARVEQAKGEYEANKLLKEKGFATATKMRQMLFDLNAAKAQLKQAEIELARTEVRANATGVVQDPIAEVGDVLGASSTCVTLVDSDPMYFVGQLSERSINFVQTGMTANIALVTGETVSGKVNYIAPAADAQTRTFRTEIQLDTSEAKIRDGLSASAAIDLPEKDAIRISPSWLTLADNGQVGVKIVDAESKVAFVPIEILAQTNQGFWVEGIEAGSKVITLGQEYVISGELVEAVPEEFKQAGISQ
ncbi:MAG: efflux RND transporter periplasmic adaptor subunit [Pseudomonadota bacterium]